GPQVARASRTTAAIDAASTVLPAFASVPLYEIVTTRLPLTHVCSSDLTASAPAARASTKMTTRPTRPTLTARADGKQAPGVRWRMRPMRTDDPLSTDAQPAPHQASAAAQRAARGPLRLARAR